MRVVFLARKELGGHGCIAVGSLILSTVLSVMVFAIASDHQRSLDNLCSHIRVLHTAESFARGFDRPYQNQESSI